jgi:pilus assembly protein CpaE
VVAAKGGIGRSFVATNLGVLLAAPRAGRAAIVDLSLQYGDVAAMLDVKTTQTIADLAAHDAVADRDLVAEVLADGPGGAHVLVGPSSPELADYVTSTHLRALLDTLQRTHEVVVADTASQLGEITLEAVERAERIVLVTDASVPGVKNARLLLNVLDVLHIPDDRCLVVLNHRDAPGPVQLDRRQIEEFLKLPVNVEIPHDPAVGTSISRGLPLALGTASPATAALQQLAEAVDPALTAPASASDVQPQRKRRFGFR